MALEVFDNLQVVESDGYLALVSSFEAAAEASLAFDIMLLPESAFGVIGKLYEERERTGSRLVLTQKAHTRCGIAQRPIPDNPGLTGCLNVMIILYPLYAGLTKSQCSLIDGFLAPLVFHLAGPSVIYPNPGEHLLSVG